MSSSDRSDDGYEDAYSSPLSPTTEDPSNSDRGGTTPTQSNPRPEMQASVHEERDIDASHQQPPDSDVKEPLRHDSLANISDDHAFYTVERRGRIRSSFSFGGQNSAKSVRQQSIVALPEDLHEGTPLRSSGQTSTTDQPPNDSPTHHTTTSTSNWSSSLIWLHQSILDISNTIYPLRARRAWEWCDYDSTPLEVRQTCQNILTKQWTRKLPPLQYASPAITACKELAEVVNEASEFENRPLEVFEFAAGSGGPTPVFEQQINAGRREKGQAPIEFRISDIYPNAEAWKEKTDQSNHLTVVEEPVDATKPPPFARSDDYKRVFRLFNLSFHHFDDESATMLLKNTFETSDGIAIIELQDRRLGCLAMMFFNIFFLFSITPFWQKSCPHCWKYNSDNLLCNAALYFRTLFTLWWDGLASCLRTREYFEFKELVNKAASNFGNVQAVDQNSLAKEDDTLSIPHWRFQEHSMVRNT